MLEEFEKKDFQKILKHNALEAHRWMKETDSSAVRVYDRNLGAFPVTVELYNEYARIVDYSVPPMADDDVTVMKDIVSRFLYIEHDRILYLARKKREGREQHEKTDESLAVEVRESGLTFECELLKYVDTGLFLDQVNTRRMIQGMSRSMRVLNLFAYTSSFSVYAAAGGAESVTSVDLSNVYCQWSRRNLSRNGFLDEGKYSVVASDARAFLEDAIAAGRVYDIVIFDPPAFSNSHKADDFDVKKDYLGFLHMISKVLAEGGVCLFSENLAGFEFDSRLLKPYWKIRELSQEAMAQGFSSKRSSLRIWLMKKTAEMKEAGRAYGRKRREMDDETIGRLTLDEEQGQERKSEAREPQKERRDGGRRSFPDRRGGYEGRERRGGYRDRERDGYGRRDDRPRYDRPRYSDDRRGGYDRGGYRDDRNPRFRDDERPRRRDDGRYERRDYHDREPRRFDDRSAGRPYRSRQDDWDNETGRFYRGERRYSDSPRRDRDYDRPSGRYDDRRPPRYRDDGSDRRPFGERDGERRRRTAPKPYGYDSFMATKKRDSADAFWLKNTVYQKPEDDE